jgi:DNA-binding NtrC family response regulator
VRIVVATNRDLRSEMEAGRFRQDLNFRLNVFPVEVEPLRRRTEEIPPLALHFAEIIARRMNRPTPQLTMRNVLDLQRYGWPGNVREPQNVIERAII